MTRKGLISTECTNNSRYADRTVFYSVRYETKVFIVSSFYQFMGYKISPLIRQGKIPIGSPARNKCVPICYKSVKFLRGSNMLIPQDTLFIESDKDICRIFLRLERIYNPM